MSGTNGIDTVSCVAGLLETLDAACRIIKQIRERRNARGAYITAVALDELEKTIKDGKDSLGRLFDRESYRFGYTLEEGDGITPSPIQMSFRRLIC